MNLCTFINNILPRITKLEEAILQLEQKFTMVQDTVQINALEFNPDIDRPNSPRACNNTAVVSVQEQLASPKPDVSDVADSKKKIHTPSMFKIIQQNSAKSLQDTASIQKKFLN